MTNTLTGGVGLTFGLADPDLPVVISSLEAATNGKDVALVWVTASEANNRGFKVQRQREGGSWEDIGFVDGEGTSSAVSEYSFVDPDAPMGRLYYRLRQEDFDGGLTYSSLVSVELSASFREREELRLFPNPVSGGALKLGLPDLEGQQLIDIRVYNTNGQLLLERTQGGTTLDVGGLASGTYILEVTVESNAHTGRFRVH